MRPVRRPIFPPPAGTHPRTAWARRSRAEAVPLGILALLFLYPVPCWAGSPIQVGGPAVQGKKVVPFTATWYQRARQSPEAEWVDNGTITETLSRGQEKGRQVLIRKQVSDDRQSGIQVVDTVVVDASALAPLRWSFEQTGKLPANAPARGGVEYSGVQIKGSLSLSSGQSVPIEAESPMPLFDAGILGLILAALPLQEGYEAEIPANYRGRSM